MYTIETKHVAVGVKLHPRYWSWTWSIEGRIAAFQFGPVVIEIEDC